MYKHEELVHILGDSKYLQDRYRINEALIRFRLHGELVDFDAQTIGRLRYFVEVILASAPGWSCISPLTQAAAEAAECLALCSGVETDGRPRLQFRAALLYELGGLPNLAQSLIGQLNLPPTLRQILSHEGPFSRLGSKATPQVDSGVDLTVQALSTDAVALSQYQQGDESDFDAAAVSVLYQVASGLSLGISCTELDAFKQVLRIRYEKSTRTNILGQPLLAALDVIQFPAELWGAQLQSLQEGLLDHSVHSWGLASPTGSGKTFLTRLLILDALINDPQAQILYIVPSRALVHEISSKLAEVLNVFGNEVISVTAQIVAPSPDEQASLQSASILVLTPEKADLLLRIGSDSFGRVRLVIVDEAHHIESGTRGILLEMYLWRIRRLTRPGTRFVFLSAVTPNIKDLVSWAGGSFRAVSYTERATRMRIGKYQVIGAGKSRRGEISYVDGPVVPMVAHASQNKKDQLLDLVLALRGAGPVLIVAKGKRECETLAEMLRSRLVDASELQELSAESMESKVFLRLDSRLEREMYPDILLRTLIRGRIAYHHAGLPPRVRMAVEDMIRVDLLDFVFATTTLAEGVNFPFSTVIVESLALQSPPSEGRPARRQPVTPRVFWNIAGRAGRPGFDREGQVILFMPSLGLDALGVAVDRYLDGNIQNIDPVGSALAAGLREILKSCQDGTLDEFALSEINISEHAEENVAGTINLIRIGIAHGRATSTIKEPNEILEDTLAMKSLSAPEVQASLAIIVAQDSVVSSFASAPGGPSIQLIAEMGLSLETVNDLQLYIRSCEDWRLDKMSGVVRHGEVNFDQVSYIVGPVAKRMAELGGRKLGAFVVAVVVEWLRGVPFSTLKAFRTPRIPRLEDLIYVIYTRVQYLLPWGLYAMDRLVEEEARLRGLRYENQIQSLAYLADAGVPNLDALRLVSLDFERVDAARMSLAFRRERARNQQDDLLRWLVTKSKEALVAVVKGSDGRRIDSELWDKVDHVRQELARAQKK